MADAMNDDATPIHGSTFDRQVGGSYHAITPTVLNATDMHADAPAPQAVWVPVAYEPSGCAWCQCEFTADLKARRCTRCLQVAYCGKVCQRAAWKGNAQAVRDATARMPAARSCIAGQIVGHAQECRMVAPLAHPAQASTLDEFVQFLILMSRNTLTRGADRTVFVAIGGGPVPIVASIGQWIHARGSTPAMHEAFAVVANTLNPPDSAYSESAGDLRGLEIAWHGIGDWAM